MFNPKIAPGVELYRTTSDEFFSELPEEIQYNLIFLDGLQTFEQRARDFPSALKHLRSGGVIVVDDVVPASETKPLPDREESLNRQLLETGQTDGEWFGDVWELPVAVSEVFADLLVVETFGHGVYAQSIIRFGKESSRINEIGEHALSAVKSLESADYFR